MCSRLSGDATPISEWCCSRGRANSVSGCHDDRGAGVSNTHPDFRDRDPEKNIQEQPRAELENPDSGKDAEGRKNEEPSEDALRTLHVPGGARLSKYVRRQARGSPPVKQGAAKRT
ncbi:hypothetical protein NDU88_001539 [Pleurodeles waltl]|uniref:Uncharacterized protein n=1 Tax=Pleurodeles waltl TaxID=8319 RepID=A0AAV7MM10_PLEWA|nr:hypothetical protein NDU88_001539 [Pleurodeles waltl]